MSSDASATAAKAHDADIVAVATHFVVRSATAYLSAGELRELAEPGAAEAPDPSADGREPAVIRALADEIYGRFYVRPEPPSPVPRDLAGHRDLINALSDANCGLGTWEPGWRVVRREADGRLVVSRDGVCFWAPAERVRPSGRAEPGEGCLVFVPKELRYLLPGFYYAVGNAPPAEDRDSGAPLARIYWNLRAAAAALRYMAEITAGLNALEVPFRTKVLSDASNYGRADSGVLYLERSDVEQAWPVVAATWERLRGELGAPTPMFSKRLADGVGLADDPGDGRSFGQVRCAILARGLWAAFGAGADDPEDRAELLRAALREHGIDPERPHLNPGSPEYDLALGSRRRRAAARAAR
jgi:hypothetical protein